MVSLYVAKLERAEAQLGAAKARKKELWQRHDMLVEHFDDLAGRELFVGECPELDRAADAIFFEMDEINKTMKDLEWRIESYRRCVFLVHKHTSQAA